MVSASSDGRPDTPISPTPADVNMHYICAFSSHIIVKLAMHIHIYVII